MAKKTRSKKTKVVRDPSAYATTSIPSRASRADPEPEAVIEPAEAEAEAGPIIATSPYDTDTTDLTDDIAPWVSLDHAQHQAAARLHYEQTLKARQPPNPPTVVLSQRSEQLVLDHLRTGHLHMPAPERDPPSLGVKEWTQSVNMVMEILKLYGFADQDVRVALREVVKGKGDVLETLEWLCIHVPADRLPKSMRDKAELGHYKGNPEYESQPVEEEKEADLISAPIPASLPVVIPEPAPEPVSCGRIDMASDTDGPSNDMLSRLLIKLGLDAYGSSAEADSDSDSDSDDDPAIPHARRSIRMRALQEWIGYLQVNNHSDRYRHKLRALSGLLAKERAAVREIEDDLVFDPPQAQREYERRWPEYYDALLDDIRRFRESEEAKLIKRDEAAEPVEEQRQADQRAKKDQRPKQKAVDVFASDADTDDDAGGCVSGVGFGIGDDAGGCVSGVGFGIGDDGQPLGSAEPEKEAQAEQTTQAIDTSSGAGWTGAAIKDLLGEAVRHEDPQAQIKYAPASASGSGHTCTLTIDWSSAGRATQQLKALRRSAPQHLQQQPMRPRGATQHLWPLPPQLQGRTRRDAENLVSLVWLYSQAALHLAPRLAPPLARLWRQWEAHAEDARRAAGAQQRAARVALLRSLRALQDEAAAPGRAAPAPRPGTSSSSSSRGGGVGGGSRQQARSLRARKWSASTIAQRLSGDAKWAGRFAEAQQQLPARRFRAHIDAALAGHQVTIVRGETGSGKSSQVPQFALAQLLAQAAYAGGRVLCTQPRRISTTAIATRVSQELGDTAPGSPDALVGYQIRFDARAHDANALVFCTTGVLLRMLADDPELKDVACIICDEVQERTLELDYLLIAMRQLTKRRSGDLRLVLMSATIDTGAFARYFGGCPVVDIPGRTFPVQSVFLENVVQMSGYALEPGSRYETADAGLDVAGLGLGRAGLGQADPGLGQADPGLGLDPQPGADPMDPAFVSPRAWAVVSRMRTGTVNLDLVCHVLAGICGTGGAHSHSAWARFGRSAVPHGAVLVFLPGIREIRALCGMLGSGGSQPLRASVIPLHSALAGDRPAGSPMTYTELAFAPADPGRRKVILATNVAETGITIPDVTVVVDCGLANQAVWDRARH
ncbi:hypothetical protein LPJ66_000916, partial [Kickxella alabastrina]